MNPPPLSCNLNLLHKILCLAEHPGTPKHEADAAWHKLFSMLKKHQLSIADLKAQCSNDDIKKTIVKTGKRLNPLDTKLAIVLCAIFDCQCLISRFDISREYRLIIIGHTSDTHLVAFFFSTLPNRILSAFLSEYPEYSHPKKHTFSPKHKKEYHSYFLGFCYGLKDLHRSDPTAHTPDSNCTALTVIKQQEINAYLHKHHPDIKTRFTRVPAISLSVFDTGYNNGLKTPLTPPLESRTP